MQTHKITGPQDRGYCITYATRIGSVQSVSSSYGPGGFVVGIAENGETGWLSGLASVIDNHGGTGAEIDAAKDAGLFIQSVSIGDVFEIDGKSFVLAYGHDGGLDLTLQMQETLQVQETRYPTGFAFGTQQEISDLVDALSVAQEELMYMSELDQDYEDEDRAEMVAKAARIVALLPRLFIALQGAAEGEARV